MKRSNAFTLIELLVVISLIALLIALLMPALTKARESSQEATCLTNMRTLMQSQLSYVTDHDTIFPSSGEWIWGKGNLNDHPDGKKFNGSTNFQNHNNDFTTREAPKYGVLADYTDNFEANFCPVSGIQPVIEVKNGQAHGDVVVRSYTMNWNVGPNWGGSGDNHEEETLGTINNAAEMVVLGEENTFEPKIRGWEDIMNDGALHVKWDHWASFHRRTDGDNLHSGYSAGGFADGHADWIFLQAKGDYNGDGRGGDWASEAFANDDWENPDEMDPNLIKPGGRYYGRTSNYVDW